MNGLLLFFNIIYVYNIDVWTHIPWFTDEHPSTHSRVGRRTGWATSRRLVWSWHLGDKAWVSPWTNGQCWMMLDDGLGGSLISLFFRHKKWHFYNNLNFLEVLTVLTFVVTDSNIHRLGSGETEGSFPLGILGQLAQRTPSWAQPVTVRLLIVSFFPNSSAKVRPVAGTVGWEDLATVGFGRLQVLSCF